MKNNEVEIKRIKEKLGRISQYLADFSNGLTISNFDSNLKMDPAHLGIKDFIAELDKIFKEF